MRIIHLILTCLLLFAVYAPGAAADEDAQDIAFREELLKEALYDDRRISAWAMFNLGQSYLPRVGYPHDYVRAYMWYTISAARNEGNAFYPTTSRAKIISRMTPEQIETAEQMARKWMMDHWGHAPIETAKADFKELQRRLAAGDSRALDEIVRRAESGDQAAQIELGNMYWESIAVKSDPNKAFNWWTMAAEGGNQEMMVKLGVIYLNGHIGRGIAPDPAKAEFWLLRAGEKGHKNAAGILSSIYLKGRGPVPADVAKYRYWYEREAEAAAREGDFLPLCQLAQLYSGSQYLGSDRSWPKDPVKAAGLYQRAADRGDIHSQTQLGKIYLAGRGVEKDEKLAFQWFLKAAENRAPIVTAWAHLVVMFEQGIGTEKSEEGARKWLDRIMAEKDYTAGSLHLIGELYHKGIDLPKDFTRAAHYYHMSSIRGKPEAQFDLGQLFWQGSGVPQSPIDAYAWWTLSLDNLFDPSQYPYTMVKAALKKADKTMSRSDRAAARRKVEQLIKEYESSGIIEGKRIRGVMKDALQKAPRY